ncbi:FG-GAP repeat domain-containing protein [Tahibacter sp. UC22_41]|uniref:FG-GAP repeat domain-containing protein n=1 Tax=Tahibacter sp. UC22_41 TaxID=3350178 RepID=UPI0036DCE329
MNRLRAIVAAALFAVTATASAAETPFATAVNLAVTGVQPRAVAIADLDRDGDQDLIVAQTSPSAIVLYRRLAGGNYATPQTLANLGSFPPRELAVVDADRDGDLDVYFARQGASSCFLITQSTGDTLQLCGLGQPAHATFGDVDGDGNDDLVAGNGTNTEWRAGSGTGGFAAGVVVSAQAADSGIVVADFNRDGRPDVVRASAGATTPGFSLHLNPGAAGSWSATTLFSDAISAVATLDLDGDGDLDLAAGRCSTTGHVILRRNDGNGVFDTLSGLAVSEPAPGQIPCPRTLLAVDLDRDGRTDLVEADSHGRVLYFRNTPSGLALERIVADSGAATGSLLHDIAVADLDLDGDPDLLAAHADQNLLTVSENRSLHRSLRSGALVTSGSIMAGAQTLLTGDVDRDGLRDVITASVSDGIVRLLRRTSAGFASAIMLPAGASAPRGGVLADMDRDGRLDLVLGSGGNGRVVQLAGDGAGGFANAVVAGSGFLDVAGVVAADFDRDGDLDLAVADPLAGDVRWLRNTGSGSYAAPAQIATHAGARALAVVDLDRDGWPDLVSAGESAGSLLWLRNALRVTAAPDFTNQVLSAAPEIAGPRDLAFADVDHDGQQDVFVLSAASGVSFLRQTAPGVFGTGLDLTTLSGSGALRVADIDGDARTDLVFLLDGALVAQSDPVGGNGGGGLSAFTAQPRLALGLDDMDNNGIADLLDIGPIGNLSLRLTQASNVQALGEFVSGLFAPRLSDRRLAGLALRHDGRSGDDAAQVLQAGFVFRRSNVNGAKLTAVEFGQMFGQLRLYADDGDGVYEPGVDPLLADTGSADFNDGVLSFAIAPPLRPTVAFGEQRLLHLVGQVAPNAEQITRVVFIGASASGSIAQNLVYASRVDVSENTSGTSLDLDVIFRYGFQ